MGNTACVLVLPSGLNASSMGVSRPQTCALNFLNLTAPKPHKSSPPSEGFFVAQTSLTTPYEHVVSERNMEQEPLFHEDLNGALGYVISALGGAKVVGNGLWPSMPVDKAGRKVSDCLNENHAQKFSLDDLLWILAEARKRGVHSAMAFINNHAGYAAPVPIEPEDQLAALQREFIQAHQGISELMRKMERFNLPAVKGVG